MYQSPVINSDAFAQLFEGTETVKCLRLRLLPDGAVEPVVSDDRQQVLGGQETFRVLIVEVVESVHKGISSQASNN